MKRLVTVFLAVLVLLSMTACSVEQEDVVGTWRRETLYMSYYNCETDMIVTISDDGTFGAVLVNHANNLPLNMAGGNWTLEEDRVLAERGDGAGTMEFVYNKMKGTLEFEGYSFKRD